MATTSTPARAASAGQGVVAGTVERVVVVPQLDQHPVPAEGVDQPVEGPGGGGRAVSTSARGTVPLRQPVSTNQVSLPGWARVAVDRRPGRLGQGLEAIRGAPCCPAICASLTARASRA